MGLTSVLNMGAKTLPDKKIVYLVEAADVGRVDALVAKLIDFSRSRVRGLIDHDGVTINSESCDDAGAKVLAGDTVEITYDPVRRYKEKPAGRAPKGFAVVYVDEHLVIVDKKSGLLTVPTVRQETNTLVDLVSTHLAKGQSRHKKVIVIHRLDRDTSGLLVFGRNMEVAGKIIGQFAAKKPEREYIAIVAGRLEKDQGTIQSYLATDEDLNQHSVDENSREVEGAKLAITHFKVRERYKNATLIVVNLETGRRNQIRVHFAEQNHPILGDARYEVEQASHKSWPYKRLALHARVLGFKHPVTGKDLRFESSLPQEFEEFARRESMKK